MHIDGLFDNLLVEVGRRIDAKEFSRTELARKAGMSQGTLSNLLLRRKTLTRNAAMKLAVAAGIEVEDLLDPLPVSIADEATLIPLVKHSIAASQPVIGRRTPVAPSGITTRAIIPDESPALGSRKQWTRYVAIRPTRRQIRLMPHSLAEDDLIILDRHDQFSQNRRGPTPSIYAISVNGFLKIGRLYLTHRELTLYYDIGAIEDVTLDRNQFIVGRVCRIFHDPQTSS